MTLLTNLTENIVRENARTLSGKTLTRPQLFAGDGTNTTYAVNVDVGNGDILYDVSVAAGNNELRYAEAGAPVTLQRTDSGRWMITGFAKIMPGTYNRVAVTVPSFDFGIPQVTQAAAVDLGLTVRPLTYEELQTYSGGYGLIPYGALALFQGGTLKEVYT